MGQGCCNPNQNQSDDHRNVKKKGDRTLENNIFKGEREELGFTVTRCDSLGMAAKEHTEKMQLDGNLDESRNSLSTYPLKKSIKSEIDTNGPAPSNEDSANVFQNETFNEAPQVLITSENNGNYDSHLDLRGNESQRSIGGVSFGGGNPDRSASQKEPTSRDKQDFEGREIGSIISIKDIVDVQKDKVPASPATRIVPEPRDNHWSGM